jgi:ABC-type microcin C transport system permease subunit YejB
MILVGYAIPGFVLGVLLLVIFGGGSFLQIFPLRGLTSDNWSELSMMGKVLDYLWQSPLWRYYSFFYSLLFTQRNKIIISLNKSEAL